MISRKPGILRRHKVDKRVQKLANLLKSLIQSKNSLFSYRFSPTTTALFLSRIHLIYPTQHSKKIPKKKPLLIKKHRSNEIFSRISCIIAVRLLPLNFILPSSRIYLDFLEGKANRDEGRKRFFLNHSFYSINTFCIG